jgi:hypothetical protein
MTFKSVDLEICCKNSKLLLDFFRFFKNVNFLFKKAFERTQALDENEFMSSSYDIDDENEATYLIPAKRSNLKTIFKRISFLLLFILVSIVLLLSRFFFQ